MKNEAEKLPTTQFFLENLDKDVKELQWRVEETIDGKKVSKTKTLRLGSALDKRVKDALSPVQEVSLETLREMKKDTKFWAILEGMRNGGAPEGKGPSIAFTNRADFGAI